MKIARVRYKGEIWLGSVNTADQSIALFQREVDTDSEDLAVKFIKSSLSSEPVMEPKEIAVLNQVDFLQPIVQPSKNVICVGKNYRAHAAEFTGSGYDSSATDKNDVIPDAPILFSKAACTMIGAHENIVVPWELSNEIDYEAELGVIIGKGGRTISEENAYEHVWGYTIINDMTARDLQSNHKQWLLGKSIDTFCPIGPWIVTADELEPEDLELNCWVNGELRQNANTGDLIFNIPSIIATASASMTLSPGDIIATGTPAGVGIGFSPPKFLKSGDTVKIEISGIGCIENSLV